MSDEFDRFIQDSAQHFMSSQEQKALKSFLNVLLRRHYQMMEIFGEMLDEILYVVDQGRILK